jgi:hypothetical protein
MNPLEDYHHPDSNKDDNHLRATTTTTDNDAISLLQQIFPEESIDHLRQLHAARCHDSFSKSGDGVGHEKNRDDAALPRSSLNRSIVPIDDAFLRLPLNVAVRRPMSNMAVIRKDQNEKRRSSYQYVLIADLERQVAMPFDSNERKKSLLYTCVLPRQNQGSLGLTLTADLRVIDISHATSTTNTTTSTRIRLGDIVWGVEGCILPRHDMNTAMEMLKSAPDPVVLHLLRDDGHLEDTHDGFFKSMDYIPVRTVPSLLDVTNNSIDESELLSTSAVVVPAHLQQQQHPLLQRLEKEGIVIDSPSTSNLMNATRIMMTTRNDDHDDDAPSTTFIPALSVRVVNVFVDPEQERAYTLWVHDVAAGAEWYAPIRYDRDFLDLRNALLSCASVKTKHNSYLYPSWNRVIQSIPFPKNSSLSASSSSKNGTWGAMIFAGRRRPQPKYGNATSPSSAASSQPGDIDAIARQLEYFLRSICAILQKETITTNQIPMDDSSIMEMAILLQSFLGFHDPQQQQQQQTRNQIPQFIGIQKDNHKAVKSSQTRLQRQIRLYTYRVLLTVDEIRQCLDDFVDVMRTQGPRWHDIEELEAKGLLKQQANQYLQRLQTFLDRWQDMIVEGCQDDFREMAYQSEFSPLHVLAEKHPSGSSSGSGGADADFWARLVREAVREQVELEVYVPLRSVVSRWLVHGWRHEDMEVSFKIKELRKRPPEFFVRGGCSNFLNAGSWNSQPKPNEWSTVCAILSDGVGLSTLPCVKLRAIVEAAKEIFRIFSTKQQNLSSGNSSINNKNKVGHSACNFADTSSHPLGADDFLPIFIYCVVQAEIERPCALCVLLRSLCDRINKIGEIGYYLLTFEAAITHCHEIDLTEDCEEMQSFLSIPLDDEE